MRRKLNIYAENYKNSILETMNVIDIDTLFLNTKLELEQTKASRTKGLYAHVISRSFNCQEITSIL